MNQYKVQFKIGYDTFTEIVTAKSSSEAEKLIRIRYPKISALWISQVH